MAREWDHPKVKAVRDLPRRTADKDLIKWDLLLVDKHLTKWHLLPAGPSLDKWVKIREKVALDPEAWALVLIEVHPDLLDPMDEVARE